MKRYGSSTGDRPTGPPIRSLMPVLGLADRLNTAIPPADVDDAEAVKRLIDPTRRRRPQQR